MRLEDDDYNHREFKGSVGTVTLLLSLAVLLVIFVVFATNKDKTSTKNLLQIKSYEKQKEDNSEDGIVSTVPKRTSQEMDFWGMYPEEGTEHPSLEGAQGSVSAEEEESPETDGNHTAVIMNDGSKEWIPINHNLRMNSYEDTGFQKVNGILNYYEQNQNSTYAGVMLTKYSSNVNFKILKKQGISYVILKLGGRGYDTGKLTVEENFPELYQEASEAGINIGVIFTTQATSMEEAAEEASGIALAMQSRPLQYPIVIEVQHMSSTKTRTDSLSKEQRTNIVKSLVAGLEAFGYKAVIAGDKFSLLMQLELSDCLNQDIWLMQEGNLPDYPYWFQAWKYADSGSLKGIEGKYGMLTSFVDYSSR